MLALRRPVLVWSFAAVIGLWLAAHVVPAGLGTVVDYRAELAEGVFQLERARRDLAGEAGLADTVDALRKELVGLAPRILAVESRAEAANTLSGLVSLAVTKGNARLLRAETDRDSTQVGMLKRVGLTVEFEADVTGVAEVFKHLAGGNEVVTVGRLRVLAVNALDAGAGPEVLRVEAGVAGWYVSRR